MDDIDDLTAEARIRHAALRLFAERGYQATTLRAIAGAAGTSPALIIHHYGSKEGLRDAVNAEVIETIHTVAIDSYVPTEEPLEHQFHAPEASFRQLFTSRPELGAYIRRLFFDGDEAGILILRQFMDISRRISAAFEERGWMRVAADPQMRDLQLIILEMGPVLFYPLLAAYFEQPPLSEDLHHRWVAAEFDMLMTGIFTDEAPSYGDTERQRT